MLKLITESRVNVLEKRISMKLFRRLWRFLQAYSQGETYADVLKLFFSQFCKTAIQSHRQISNTSIDEN